MESVVVSPLLSQSLLRYWKSSNQILFIFFPGLLSCVSKKCSENANMQHFVVNLVFSFELPFATHVPPSRMWEKKKQHNH